MSRQVLTSPRFSAILPLVILIWTLPKLLFGQQIQFPSTSSTPWNPPPTTNGQLFPSAPPANTGWASAGTIQPSAGNPSAFGGSVLPGQLNSAPSLTYGPATVTPLNSAVPNFGSVGPGYNYNFNSAAPGAFPNNSPPALFPSNSTQAPFGFGGSGSSLGSKNSIFPDSWLNGNNWRLGSGWFNNGTNPLWNGNVQPPSVIRFFQGVRFRHTWVAGDDQPGDIQPDALEINDSDVSVAFAIPRFFGSTQPLFLVPSFSSHLWEGPSNGIADLPGSAYSAFLDTGWQTDPMRTFGLETGIRLGVFTDYETFNSDSFRIMGKLLGRVRVTPTSVGRLGVYWLDRDRIKLLPAAGITWTPNPDTRFDLFFPEPKLAHYLATVGKADMWWYTTGYLGGGAWTITRAVGAEDSVDIYDLRIMGGLEFGRNDLLRSGQRNAFIEAGYAFNRELIYRIRPQDNLDVEDSFVLRAGFGY